VQGDRLVGAARVLVGSGDVVARRGGRGLGPALVSQGLLVRAVPQVGGSTLTRVALPAPGGWMDGNGWTDMLECAAVAHVGRTVTGRSGRRLCVRDAAG
jgi:hypothetical protein